MIVIDDDELFWLYDGTYEWQDRPFTGIARSYYTNGDVSGEIEYVDGLQHGLARFFYAPGKLMGESHWRKNSLHGPKSEWFPSGNVRREALFEHAYLVRDRQWDESGNLMKDFTLTEDHPNFRLLEMSRKRHSQNP
jgi:antitoxin component YwqK of YwqJK toxin-antitoxin module